MSYLVQPVGDSESVNFSIAHGASRKLKRQEMRGRLSHKYSPESLAHTKFGGRVIWRIRNYCMKMLLKPTRILNGNTRFKKRRAY